MMNNIKLINASCADQTVDVVVNAANDDKHRETANFYCPSEYFRDYFNAIKLLVPDFEDTPKVLWTSDDEEIDDE